MLKKKIMRNTFIYLCFLLFSVGCMEDKGNYEYREVNRLSISGLEKLYSVEQMEVLELNPKITFSQEESKDLSYDWQIRYKKVSEQPTLNKPIGTDFGRWPASLTVTDNKTGLKSTYDFEVEVMNPYGRGLFVLSQKEDGTAMLSFQRRYPEVGKFKSEIFTHLNPEHGTLGKKPQMMISVDIRSEKQLYILCEEGDKKIALLNLENMKYNSAVNENIVVGGYTGSFNPSYIVRYFGGTGIVSNGKFFSYNNARSKLLYRPVEGDYMLTDYITANEALASNYWVGFDKNKHRIVSLASGANRYDFSDIKYWTFEGNSTYQMTFVAGANYGRVNYGNPLRTQLKKIILAKDGSLHFFELALQGERDRRTGKVKPKIELKKDMEIANIGDETSAYAFGEKTSYWFVGSGNKIYRVYANGGTAELWYTLERGVITTMKLTRNEKSLFVGAKVESSGDILVIDAMKKATLQEPVYKDVCKVPVSLVLK